MYVRTLAGARSETSAHYNTGLVPVLTLQSHGLIEFLLLCVTAASVIPVLALIFRPPCTRSARTTSVGRRRTWWV